MFAGLAVNKEPAIASPNSGILLIANASAGVPSNASPAFNGMRNHADVCPANFRTAEMANPTTTEPASANALASESACATTSGTTKLAHAVAAKYKPAEPTRSGIPLPVRVIASEHWHVLQTKAGTKIIANVNIVVLSSADAHTFG